MAATFVFLFLCSTLVFAQSKVQVDAFLSFKAAIEGQLGGHAGWNPATVAPCDWFSVACTTPSSTSLHLSGPVLPSLALPQNLQVLHISSNDLTQLNIPKWKFFNVSNMQRQQWIIAASIVVSATILIVISSCCHIAFIILRLRRRLRQGFTGQKKHGPTVIMGANVDNSGEPKVSMFSNNFYYAQVLDVTHHFDDELVVSRGRYGVVHKASFPDIGTTLSILRLPDVAMEEGVFRKEVEVLSKVKHCNLTVLRGYYAGPPPDVHLLVYDYMPNDDLASLLKTAGHVLNWPLRHLIALGVARGLSFLHTLAIVHGDVKPQNVLFDADFEPHLADFGLDKLYPAASPANTFGYVSPEVARSGRATKKGDVYSFGVLLLELLTGMRPTMFGNEEGGIVKWMKRMVQSGQMSELIGPRLLGLQPESTECEEFVLGMKVALLCTLPDPIDRPPMSDVVLMLEGCRVSRRPGIPPLPAPPRRQVRPDIPPLPTPPRLHEQSSVVGLSRDNDDCSWWKGCRQHRVGVWSTSTYQSVRKFLKN